MRSHHDAGRGLGLFALACASSVLTLLALGQALRHGHATPAGAAAELERIVALALWCVAAATGAWYAATAAVLAACAGARWLGGPWRLGERAVRRCGAPLLRRAAGAAVGVALGVGLGATGALAAPADIPDNLGWGTAASAPVTAQTGSTPAPSASSATPATPPPPAPPGAAPSSAPPGLGSGPAGSSHRVAPGESLWSIAAQALATHGEEPTVGAIAAEWPRWYAANSAVIGADPDVIHPGQNLTSPLEGTQP